MVLKSRPVVTMAGAKADIFEDRMAEWLRPRTSIAENRLNIRRISVGSILPLKEVYRLGGWCKNHVPSLLWLAPKSIIEGRMAEWLRPERCKS